MVRTLLLTFVFLLIATPALAQISPEMQIKLALQAAPEEARAGATVQGYNDAGDFVTLREGTNDLICMAPDPAANRLEVSCHHESLEPYFKRGRELSAAGVTGQERMKTRWEEVEAGTLPLPSGITNTILVGTGYDEDTGEITDPFIRWVVYMPGATGASVGLPERPAGPGAPWVMFPGTPGAHLMITPAR